MKPFLKIVPAILGSLIFFSGCAAQSPARYPSAYSSDAVDAVVDENRRAFKTLGLKGLHLGMSPDRVNELVQKTPWGYETCDPQPETSRFCQDAPQTLPLNRLTGDRSPMGASWLQTPDRLSEEDDAPLFAYHAAQIEFTDDRLTAIGLASPPWAPGDIDTRLTEWARCAVKRLAGAYGPPDTVNFALSAVNFLSFRPGFDITAYEWRLADQTIRLTIGADDTRNRFDCTVQFLAATGFADRPETLPAALPDRRSRQVTSRDRASASTWLKKSYASLSRKDWSEALAQCTRALSYHPRLDAAYANRSWALAELGRLDRAVRDADRALAINPENAMAYNNRGLAFQLKGDLDQALADYQDACHRELTVACRNLKELELLQTHVAEGLEQSRTMLAAKDWDAAVRAADAVIQLAPGHAEAYVNRALARLEKGLFRQAADDCSRVLTLRPGYSSAYYYRARALERLGKPHEAMGDYAVSCDLGFDPACVPYARLALSASAAAPPASAESRLP